MIRTAFAAIVLAAATSSALAEIKLASLFTDHMVVQRGQACPIWGTATPGAKVEVTVDGEVAASSTVANDKGFFRAKLPVLGEGKPHTITVKAGDDVVTVSDVLAGEVWIASGQSNMQWTVWDSGDRENEVKNGSHPNIRMVTLPHVTSDTPLETFDAKWQVCSPETVSGFSAVGYSFARKLSAELNVPVGIIHTSWGGTIAEAWTPAKQIEQLNVLPGVAKLSQTLKESLEPDAKEKYAQAVKEWNARMEGRFNDVDPATADYAKPEYDDADWKTLNQPGNWRTIDIPNGCGWIRRSFDVPAELAGKEMTLSLGKIDEYDSTYINGEKVGATVPTLDYPWNVDRNYTVPANLVKAGKNTIAIRIFDTGGAAGIAGPAGVMKLSLADDVSKAIPLTGEWKAKLEKALDPQADPRPQNIADTGNPNLPSRLYNAMIHPLHDFAVKGAIWYQGESNAGRAGEYEKVLSTMIGSWREQLGVGEFPFYQVGLANFMAPTDDANKQSDWAHLREAQRQIGRNVKNAGMTVTIDIGEEKDIHPKNKQDVGKRLALMALSDTYEKSIVSRGPTLKDVKFDGAKVVVSFDHIGGGLSAKDGKLESFSIAGDDGKFAWADASIEGNTVVLSSKDVPNPTQVRYAFADNPKATLFNKEGLPAEPFEAKK